MKALFWAPVLALILAACGHDTTPGSEDSAVGTAADGGESSDTGSPGLPAVDCRDAMLQPSDNCAVEPDGEVCEASPNPSCAGLTQIEVTDSQADGPCLRIVTDSHCSDIVYIHTCIEHDDGEHDGPKWQCWASTTWPGAQVDVAQCHATGRWHQWGSMSKAELDLVDGECNPLR